jgi:ribonuclease T2
VERGFLFRGIVVPDRYHDPDHAFPVTAASIRQEFRATNPSLRDTGLVVICKGHFLSELRLCLSKDSLTVRVCDRTIRDDLHGQMTVRPLQ